MIEFAPDYFITIDGDVISHRRGAPRTLSPKTDRDGYLEVCICNPPGTRIMCKVHRIVANAFISNPEGLSQVNHKDGVKTNNTITNLEWCTPRTNLRHARDQKLRVYKLDQATADAIRCEHLSVAELVSKYKISETQIRRVLKKECWA